MRIKNQAVLLNMYANDGIYEKTVDGYRVQFVAKCNPEKIKKSPCLVFMVGRTIDIEEQRRLLSLVTRKKIVLHFLSSDVSNDTVCMHVKINNKNIDLVMYGIYQMISTFIKLQILPPNENTYNKYKFTFSDETCEHALTLDI